MAKLHAEYDTKTKQLTVTQDGKALPNVQHVEFGRSYDSDDNDENPKHVAHVVMRDKNKDEGMTTHTHLTANEHGDMIQEDKVDNKLSNFIGGFLRRNTNAKKK